MYGKKIRNCIHFSAIHFFASCFRGFSSGATHNPLKGRQPWRAILAEFDRPDHEPSFGSYSSAKDQLISTATCHCLLLLRGRNFSDLQAILLIRGHKVMLDRDLAALYEVETRVLNQAVRRNAQRFPEDFMFQLTQEEFENWRSQIVISNPATKMGMRKRPYAFTEQGVAMLSSVLRSDRAIEVNIAIMRAFVKLRDVLASHKDFARKLEDIERKLGQHDEHFRIVFEAIRQLMTPVAEPTKKGRIGFARD
jgi:hypothetical protein